MMKKLLFIALIMVFGLAQAQIPEGYYEEAQGLSGYALKTKLSEITGEGYISHSYGDLWDAYYTTDVDQYYENDGTVLDVYSENPAGEDSYEYTFGDDQCGNYSNEGSCYNREHLMPQSWFDSDYPMKADIHHIYPTDGYVNGQRGHLPFGEVVNASFTSDNGSKKGPNAYAYPGAYSGTVFEPIDEFKGDIARVYFYMATRYENQIAGWQNANDGSQNTLNGSSDQVFTDWMLNMLLAWNAEDPVSQREIDRNNAAYDFQGNRNPFIDHPEYVDMIWESDDTEPSDIIFNEDFNTCASVPNNFTAVSELSPIDWECTDQYGENNTGAEEMNAYSNGEQVPSLDWLITADPIDFNNYTEEKLSFFVAATFGNTHLQLLYSTDYDGNGNPSDFTWQPVPNVDIPLYPSDGNGVVETTFSNVDISEIDGENVYLAFKYDTTDGQEATRWTVDSFKILGTENLGTAPKQTLKLALYPNPVTGERFTVEVPRAQQFNLKIYTLSGKLLQYKTYKTNQAQISTDGLSTGLYLIRISSQGRSVGKQLIVR